MNTLVENFQYVNDISKNLLSNEEKETENKFLEDPFDTQDLEVPANKKIVKAIKKAVDYKKTFDKPAPSKKSETPKKASPTKYEKVFIEPIYAVQLSNNTDVAVAEKSENLTFYKWTNSYWKSMTTKRAQADALQWLETHYADKATEYLANSCMKTAALSLMNKSPMPPKGDEIIIPLQDRWLKVSEDGKITNVTPNKAVGITHQINAKLGITTEDYVPAELPKDSLFAKFLNSSLPDLEEQAVLQEYSGMTLLPDTRYQRALVLEGPGGNGKNVYSDILSAMHQNVAAVNLEKISGFGLSELPDASLVVVSETPSKGLHEEQFKQLVSGDKVVIDIKGKSQFTCRPFAKWVVLCNKFPTIKDESEGIWRRIIILKFKNKFKGQDKIMNLATKIIDTEMKLVLDWALLGLQRLLARGENGDFILPEHVKQYTESEKTNSNNVAPFIEDSYLSISQNVLTKKEEIYLAYIKYCEGRAVMPFGDVQLWKRINQHFPELTVVQKREANGRKYYVNIFFDYTMAYDKQDPFKKQEDHSDFNEEEILNKKTEKEIIDDVIEEILEDDPFEIKV